MDSREKLVLAIEKHADIGEIKDLLLSMPREQITKEDDQHFDILHYTIQANYNEVVHLLFLRGFFTEPDQPTNVPYLNLACRLGHTSIVSILLKERPNDIHRLANRCAMTEGHGHCSGDICGLDNKHLKYSTPLDLAAEGGNLKCLRMLLLNLDTRSSSNQGRKAFKREKTMSLLESAVEQCSTKAVRLLLFSNEAEQNDINSAFKMALHRKLADCLDILLSHGHVEVQAILNDMNPYHVLFMYSSAYQVTAERNYSLDESTAVLVKHGFGVNDYSKNGSFPVYSLINSLLEEKDFFPLDTPKYHLSALDILIDAGADLNFDEIRRSQGDQTRACGATVGRPLYTCALNALFGSLQNCDNWYAMFPEFITHCCGLLLRGGCNPRQIDARGRTALHDIMKCLAMEHTMGNMDVNALPVIQILLRYGADPNMYSSNEMYPASSYFHTLFNIMGGRLAIDNWKLSKCQSQVLQLLTYMTHSSKQTAAKQIIHACQIAEDQNDSSVSVISHMTNMLQNFTHSQLNLQDLCRLQIWEAIDRQRDRLQYLPLPTALSNSVLTFFC